MRSAFLPRASTAGTPVPGLGLRIEVEECGESRWWRGTNFDSNCHTNSIVKRQPRLASEVAPRRGQKIGLWKVSNWGGVRKTDLDAGVLVERVDHLLPLLHGCAPVQPHVPASPRCLKTCGANQGDRQRRFTPHRPGRQSVGRNASAGVFATCIWHA